MILIPSFTRYFIRVACIHLQSTIEYQRLHRKPPSPQLQQLLSYLRQQKKKVKKMTFFSPNDVSMAQTLEKQVNTAFHHITTL